MERAGQGGGVVQNWSREAPALETVEQQSRAVGDPHSYRLRGDGSCLIPLAAQAAAVAGLPPLVHLLARCTCRCCGFTHATCKHTGLTPPRAAASPNPSPVCAAGSCMKAFEWSGGGHWGGKPWSSELPTDSALVFYLFAAFLAAPQWLFTQVRAKQAAMLAVTSMSRQAAAALLDGL